APVKLVTVIHLVVNELDADQSGTDTREFVEIATGLETCTALGGGILQRSLTGYTIVFWTAADNSTYLHANMAANTDAQTGMFLVGNQALNPQLHFADDLGYPINSAISNDTGAVALYQAPDSSFTSSSTVTSAHLIDALVYRTTASVSSATTLLG